MGTCPRALDGVGVTFVLQFHTRKHYKTAIQSQCMASERLFPIFAFKITHRVILLTQFCKLLTRVATPSGEGGGKCLNGTTLLVLTWVNISLKCWGTTLNLNDERVKIWMSENFLSQSSLQTVFPFWLVHNSTHNSLQAYLRILLYIHCSPHLLPPIWRQLLIIVDKITSLLPPV